MATITAQPPTAKQRSFIESLLSERDVTGTPYENWTPDWDSDGCTKAAASVVIDYLLKLPKTSNTRGTDAVEVERAGDPVPPAGRYALYHYPSTLNRSKALDKQWSFFKVDHGKGRWEGRVFVTRLVGNPGDYREVRVDYATRSWALATIAADPKKASADFGKQSGHCGVCASALSDPESLARGIGPVCAGRF